MTAFSEQDITNYVLGRLEQEKASALEQQLTHDTELQKRIHMEQLLHKGITHFGQNLFKDRIRKTIRQRRQKRWMLGLAVGALIMIIAALLVFNWESDLKQTVDQPEVIYAQHYEAPSLMGNMRSNGEVDLSTQLRTAYGQSNWEVILDLTGDEITWRDQPEVALMRMIALMENGDFEGAVAIDQGLSISDDRYDDHIEWYASLSLLRMGEIQLALSRIEVMASDEEHDHQKDAQQLLENL